MKKPTIKPARRGKSDTGKISAQFTSNVEAASRRWHSLETNIMSEAHAVCEDLIKLATGSQQAEVSAKAWRIWNEEEPKEFALTRKQDVSLLTAVTSLEKDEEILSLHRIIEDLKREIAYQKKISRDHFIASEDNVLTIEQSIVLFIHNRTDEMFKHIKHIGAEDLLEKIRKDRRYDKRYRDRLSSHIQPLLDFVTNADDLVMGDSVRKILNRHIKDAVYAYKAEYLKEKETLLDENVGSFQDVSATKTTVEVHRVAHNRLTRRKQVFTRWFSILEQDDIIMNTPIKFKIKGGIDHGHKRVITMDEMIDIVNKERNIYRKALLACYIWQGSRPSEPIILRKSSLNFDENRLDMQKHIVMRQSPSLKQSLTREYEYKTEKSYRLIQMNKEFFIPIMKEHLANLDNDNDLLFPSLAAGETRGDLWNPKTFNHYVQTLVPDDISPQWLRRSCATWLNSRGMPPLEVSDFLGNTEVVAIGSYIKQDLFSYDIG